MKSSKKLQRIISVLCALMMVIVTIPLHQPNVAKAVTLKYESCLYNPEPGQKHGSVYNKEDVCSSTITISREDKLKLNGWVLSNIQISYYRILFVLENEPAPRKEDGVTASSWDFSKDTNVDVSSLSYNITKNGFITKNDKWEYNLDSSWMLPGNWTVYVKGYLTGNNKEIAVAKVKIKVTPTITIYTNGYQANYWTCNDNPNPSKTKRHYQRKPSVVKLTNTYKVGAIANPDKSIPVSGWALHEDGIQSYSYKIVNVNGAQCGLGKLTPYSRPDLVKTSKTYGLMQWGLTTAGYSGNIAISGLPSGQFTAIITGKTLDGIEFTVAEIQFNVLRYYRVTAENAENDKHSVVCADGTTLDLEKTFGSYYPDHYGYYHIFTDPRTNNQPIGNTIVVRGDRTVGVKTVANTCKATFLEKDGTIFKSTVLTSGEKTFRSICGGKIPASSNSNEVFVGWEMKNDPKKMTGESKLIYLPDDICIVDDSDPKVYTPVYRIKGEKPINYNVAFTTPQLLIYYNAFKDKYTELCKKYEDAGGKEKKIELTSFALEFWGTAVALGPEVLAVLSNPVTAAGALCVAVIGTVATIAGMVIGTFFGNTSKLTELAIYKHEYENDLYKICGYISAATEEGRSFVIIETNVECTSDGAVKYKLYNKIRLY